MIAIADFAVYMMIFTLSLVFIGTLYVFFDSRRVYRDLLKHGRSDRAKRWAEIMHIAQHK